MALGGAGAESIAERAHVDPRTVRAWVLRYNREGVEGLRDRGKGGRPPVISGAALDMLQKKLATAKGPVQVHELREMLKKRLGLTVSKGAVLRVLRGEGFAPGWHRVTRTGKPSRQR